MSNSMLDQIVRSLVGVDTKHHGIILDASNKLGGDNAAAYHKQIAATLREPLPSSDIVINVDRSVKPTYPDWVKEVMHPELECSGPADFGIATLRMWQHDGQNDKYRVDPRGSGRIFGEQQQVKHSVVYEHLKTYGILASCLNLQAGLAIAQKGEEILAQDWRSNDFRRYAECAGDLYLWGSVVKDFEGNLRVPVIYTGGRFKPCWMKFSSCCGFQSTPRYA